jgi:hypothetical protein
MIRTNDEDAIEKARENRLRRMASRQGFRLSRSRSRNPDAYEYGLYLLVNIDNCCMIDGWVSLDTIEAWLRDDDEQAAA